VERKGGHLRWNFQLSIYTEWRQVVHCLYVHVNEGYMYE
jgi:hypothetical protein